MCIGLLLLNIIGLWVLVDEQDNCIIFSSLLEHFHFLKVFTIHGVDMSSLLESISMTNVHYVHNSIV